MNADEAVINFNKISPGSIIASNMIATYISQRRGCDLIDRRSRIRKERYRRLWVVNGSPVWSDFVHEAKYLVEKAEEVVWVGNDYAIPVWSPVRKTNLAVLAAYDRPPGSELKAPFIYLNWNQLAFAPQDTVDTFTYSGLSYYGAFREDRVRYFEKYFRTNLYKVWVSPSGAPNQFSALAPEARLWSSKDLLSGLAQFESTLYIEDERTHRLYCSPANRFYEAAAAGVFTLFDVNCRATFERAGIDVEDFIVDGPADVERLLKARAALLPKQRARFRLDWRARLDAEFGAALGHLAAALTRPARRAGAQKPLL